MEIREKNKLAEQIRVFRAKYRLSQTKLGEEWGISQRLISYIETESWENISEKTINLVKEKLAAQKKAQK